MSGAPNRISFQYRLWDYLVISDFDLGELEPAHEDDCPYGTLHLSLVPNEDWAEPDGDAVIEYRLDDGRVWFASSKIGDGSGGDGYIARFPGLCSFRIQPEEMRIDCALQSDLAESTIAHLILDQAIPRLLSLKEGYVVLHASAVQVGNQVIAVLGQSGQGKSTLAAWLGSQGFPLLTDDCLVLKRDEPAQQWLALPSYQSVRLWPDSVEALGIEESGLREFASYSSKKRTSREVDFRFASGGSPLRACFVLADKAAPNPTLSGEPVLRSLSINEAFIALVQGVFRLDVQDAQLNRQEFEVLTSVTETVRFWSLSYERKYHWLPKVQKAIIEAVQPAATSLREGKL